VNKIGIITRSDNRGLGVQTHEAVRHLDPAKVLVVNIPSEQPLTLRPERFRGAHTVNGWPTPNDMAAFLKGFDAVYTAETPYHYSLFSIAEQMGIQTVLHVNPEFCDKLQRDVPDPTLYLAPTTWLWDELPNPKRLLPFPVDLTRFGLRQMADRATHFLHIVGRPAIHDRAGTVELLYALEHVKESVRVTIRCQTKDYVQSLIKVHGITIPAHVELDVKDEDVYNYWEMYEGQVLVAPRRYGGMSLPMQEAVANMMPVISLYVEPQRDWLPADWLVPAVEGLKFPVRTMIQTYAADVPALAAKIDQFASDAAYYKAQSYIAARIADTISWKTLLPQYLEVLSGL